MGILKEFLPHNMTKTVPPSPPSSPFQNPSPPPTDPSPEGKRRELIKTAEQNRNFHQLAHRSFKEKGHFHLENGKFFNKIP